MIPEMRRARLTKLRKIEGFEDENDLFATAISDSVCPAICCNPDNPECDYTEEIEPDSREGWCEECQHGTRGVGARARRHRLNHRFAEHRARRNTPRPAVERGFLFDIIQHGCGVLWRLRCLGTSLST